MKISDYDAKTENATSKCHIQKILEVSQICTAVPCIYYTYIYKINLIHCN